MAKLENTTNLVCKRHRQALARRLGPRVQFLRYPAADLAVDARQPCAANLTGCRQLASYQFEIVHPKDFIKSLRRRNTTCN